VRLSAAFLARFFALAAALFALWSFAGLGDAYGRFVIAVTNPAIWALSGYRVDAVVPKSDGLDIFIAKGPDRALVPLQPREMFSGLIPFLALVGAAGGLTWRRRLRAAGSGAAALFLFHCGTMLLAPYMTGLPQGELPTIEWVRRVNRVIDVVYAFYVLVGYAALPFLHWYWLTQSPTPASAPAAATSAPRRRT
jgi:hypothetical protein